MTVEEISSTSESRRGELDRRTAEFNASFEQLLEEKITRENELIHNVALKEKELADSKNAHRNAEEREKTLKEALAQAENDAKLDAEKNRAKVAELGQVIGERERTLRERETELEGLRGDKARLEKDRAEGLARIEGQDQQRLELEALILGLRNDLAGTREEIDGLIREQRFELEAQKEIVDGLRGDLASTEATLAETERDLSEQLEEVRTNLALRGGRTFGRSGPAATAWTPSSRH
jgi:chromosome segregation ATPase